MTVWRQLVYTSADFDNGSRGGWGVKLASPETFRGSTEAVLITVDTRLFAAEDVGDFPTAEVLERRHRQLTARRDGAGRLLLHAVAAGTDATGRPGNVFVHAAQADLSGVTAIELWRSDDWLTPFGPTAVSGSRLPVQISAGTAVTRGSVAAFLATPGRLEVLAVLVERLAAVQRDGGVIVLLVESPDEASQWIGALTFARDVRSEHELGWTTWSRAESLTTMREARVHVAGVARAEESSVHAWVAASRDSSVVIDTRAAVRRDGAAWTRLDGARLAEFGIVSSVITSVQGALTAFGSDVLRDLLDDAHDLVQASSGDFTDPLWAFAAVSLTDPDVELDAADRGLLTRSLIDHGPRAQRPALVDTAVDDWWRQAPDDVVDVLRGPGAVIDRDLLVGRRVVLLLAGELMWSDEIDSGLRLESAAAIADELANARERVEGLLTHRTRLDEAATILRVFEGYGVAATPMERDVLRERLVYGVDGQERLDLLDRTWPPMEAETTPTAPEPPASPGVEAGPVAEAAAIVEGAPAEELMGLEDWLVAQELAATQQAVETAAPDPWPTAPPAPAPATATWDEARPAGLLEHDGLTEDMAGLADLVDRWVVCMAHRKALDTHDVESLREAVDTERIRPDDVARVLVHEDRQTVLDVLKRAASAAEFKLAARPPFDIAPSRTMTNTFSYLLVVEVFRLVVAGPDARWWESHTKNHALFNQAWSKAGGRR